MLFLIRKFVVLFVTALFLLAYTGMNITRHTCVACHKTIYYLISHTDCCTGHYKTHTSHVTSCNDNACENRSHDAAEENCGDKGCCHSEKIYVKATNTFTYSNFSYIAKALSATVSELPELLKVIIAPELHELLYTTYRPPPPLSAKQRVILFHRLTFYA